MNSDNGKVGRRRVVVTGIGVVSPNGIGAKAFWHATKRGVSGIDKITHFDPTDLACQIAGEVKNFQPETYLTPKELRRVGRAVPLAIAATERPVRLWPGFELRSYEALPRPLLRGVLWYGVKANLHLNSLRC